MKIAAVLPNRIMGFVINASGDQVNLAQHETAVLTLFILHHQNLHGTAGDSIHPSLVAARRVQRVAKHIDHAVEVFRLDERHDLVHDACRRPVVTVALQLLQLRTNLRNVVVDIGHFNFVARGGVETVAAYVPHETELVVRLKKGRKLVHDARGRTTTT